MEFRIGDEVLATWLTDGFLYPAVLVRIDGPSAHVAYLDGAEADVPLAALRNGAFGPGLSVSVNWKGKGRYYHGSIVSRIGAALFMAYEDGTQGWTTIGQCRLQAAAAALLPAEHVVCTYCGVGVDARSPRCGSCGGPRQARG